MVTKYINFWIVIKIIMQYKRIGYNIDVIRQSACLAVNPITVNKFAVLFNCMPVGRGSDSMIAQHKVNYLVGWGWTLVCSISQSGSNWESSFDLVL